MMSEIANNTIADPERLASFFCEREKKVFQRGEELFAQGTGPTGLYCVQSGYILLWHEDTRSNRTGFRIVGPGETMGYRSLFGAEPHAATAQALSTCNVCRYPKHMVIELTRNEPDFALSMLTILARDRGPSDALILRAGHLSVRTRLVRLLLILEKRYGNHRRKGKIELRLPLLRRDIALLIGSRAESVTRAAKDLSRDGVAHFHRDTVDVLDAVALSREGNLDGEIY